MTTPQQVHQFWFGSLQDEHDLAKEKAKLWFGGGEEVDAQITEQFGDTLKRARHGELEDWKGSARDTLSLIIVLDQLSRNIYRGKPEAFAGDHISRQLSIDLIDSGLDQELYPVERVFAYLPLEHSERLSDQLLCLKCMERLEAQATESTQQAFRDYREYAQRHLDLIERFGRFPHRNAILGRASTAQEAQYMEGGGESFGQRKEG